MPAVPIRNTRPSSRVVTEPIPDVGDAVLGWITAFPSTWLIGDDRSPISTRSRPGRPTHPQSDRPLTRDAVILVTVGDFNTFIVQSLRALSGGWCAVSVACDQDSQIR